MAIIKRTRIIGTRQVIYDAWEPSRGHSTITHADEHGWLGRIGSRRLPPDLAALRPYSQERREAVAAWHESQYQEAYSLILAEYPAAADGYRSMGDISCVEE
uniref:Uncharacterized protein n=1 Tax=viral metagenome TaxID=1070528 RepID=A0A6M3M5H9_9ZZZZ